MSVQRAIGIAAAVALLAATAIAGWLLLDVSRDEQGDAASWFGYQIDGTQLVVHYIGDTCEVERWLEVEETSTRVIVTVHVRDGFSIPFFSGCATDGAELSVQLDAPVVNRAVYDGACLAAGGSTHRCRERETNEQADTASGMPR